MTYGRAIALLVAGSVLILIGFALTWSYIDLPLLTGIDDATRTQASTGQSLFPAAAACGWVCLAGVAGVLATRTWGRAVVGAIIVVAALVVIVTCVSFAIAPTGVATGWWAVALLGAAVAGAVGVLTVVHGRTWPSMGSRYERTTSRTSVVSPWDALDKGVDPTEDP